MTVLVIAEHDNASIKPATLNTVTAAAQCGGDVHVLIAGHNAGEAAKAAAAIAGVAKVIHADAPGFEHGLAENVAAQVLAIAGDYSHILFPATASGKASHGLRPPCNCAMAWIYAPVPKNRACPNENCPPKPPRRFQACAISVAYSAIIMKVRITPELETAASTATATTKTAM